MLSIVKQLQKTVPQTRNSVPSLNSFSGFKVLAPYSSIYNNKAANHNQQAIKVTHHIRWQKRYFSNISNAKTPQAGAMKRLQGKVAVVTASTDG